VENWPVNLPLKIPGEHGVTVAKYCSTPQNSLSSEMFSGIDDVPGLSALSKKMFTEVTCLFLSERGLIIKDFPECWTRRSISFYYIDDSL
jgi:hypothetical protein